MPQDLPDVLMEKTQVSFFVPKLGLYAISIAARCKGKNDLRIEIDGRIFREIPPKENIQKYDIPPAWNGRNLRGLKQINIFLIKLDEGKHIITFSPEGQTRVEEWTQWRIENSSNAVFDLNQQAENGDKRPWFTFVLIDFPLKSLAVEISTLWHLFDGDDVKLIVDNKIEPNSNSKLWKDWAWHATPSQIFSGSKKEQKTFNKNLPSGIHYIEFWADKTPTLHQVVLNLGAIELPNTPTVDNPKWTKNFADDPDQIILARALFGEARNVLVPDEARIAIGWVIRHRVESSRWPDTYWEVITTPYQFSSFTLGDPNRPYIENPLHKDSTTDKEAWEHAYEIAGKVIGDKSPDPTNGANHYYDDSINAPPWAKDQQPTLTISYINKYGKEASIFFFKL